MISFLFASQLSLEQFFLSNLRIAEKRRLRAGMSLRVDGMGEQLISKTPICYFLSIAIL